MSKLNVIVLILSAMTLLSACGGSSGSSTEVFIEDVTFILDGDVTQPVAYDGEIIRNEFGDMVFPNGTSVNLTLTYSSFDCTIRVERIQIDNGLQELIWTSAFTNLGTDLLGPNVIDAGPHGQIILADPLDDPLDAITAPSGFDRLNLEILPVVEITNLAVVQIDPLFFDGLLGGNVTLYSNDPNTRLSFEAKFRTSSTFVSGEYNTCL